MTAERMPPHDIGAEQAVISSALLDADCYALVADRLPARRFFAEAHRRIWEAIGELVREERVIDLVSVAGKLRDSNRLHQVGGAEYLAEVVDATPATAHVEDHADRIVSLSRLRDIAAEAQRIAAEAYNVRGDAQAFIDQAENAIYQIAHTDQRRDIVSLSTATQESWDQICKAAERRGAPEFPTGLDRFDAKLALRRQELTTIAARPGMGKTSMVLGAAVHLAELGHPVAIFELEMPREQLATRMACTRAGIDLHRVMTGFVHRDEWAALLEAKEYLAKLPIWIDDSAGATLLHIRASSRTVQARNGALSLIVVDYLQLMSGLDDRDRDSREQEISTNMRGLKRLARELNVPVIVLSQLNRKVEDRPDKRPQLSDLRDSGAIEQDSDNVVFIYRPEYYSKEKTADEDRGVAELDVGKQRNGPTGRVRVAFRGATVSFSNLESNEPDYQQPLHWTEDAHDNR